MAVSGTRHTPANTPAMPTSAYACGGATAPSPTAPVATATGVSKAPYADPSAAPMNSDGAYTPPTKPDWRHNVVAASFARTSSSRSVGGYGVRKPPPSAPSIELTLSKPWYVTSGKSRLATPKTNPPSGACQALGTRG